ncbi:hypothetical protein BTM_6179 (plasmid) [Burkholderia thailandensis 34]|uniref:hypothetical protein n=1 Tax=Burkholderia thailandensis TaxID=57975 RepID=UPI0005F1930A|nr:hypothetical protein [Burkholderia thailandensis]AJY27108.1 hypothetical protein BTM_6179 [Burkholderia thailandensis 34]AOJ58551.1 hypothetical protein AQ477_18150 [Burkholderia thailandensis]KXF59749.1 hypothetical protein AQ476_18165 [Burkholderia thailandensis]PNE73202.1 hypothetical protein A8H37_13960 [Burkholderia thailandensis]
MKEPRKRASRSAIVLGLIGLGSALSFSVHAQSVVLPFMTHATFFSTETQQPVLLDPQVFVADPAGSEGVGPQGIRHVAGVRNARVADSGSLSIVNASHKPLDMTLGDWLGADGDVVLTRQANGREKITVVLSHLKPNGRYSLFENHFDQKPVGFTPLDGTGDTNSFVADSAGHAVVTTITPVPLTHDNAVLVVYHSDGQAHGRSRGNIGVDAHHQLIARP